jgi:hypothetical protein
MGQVLLGAIGLFLVWDVVWWFLGVKPRFPWQLKARLGAGPSDLVWLDVRTPSAGVGRRSNSPRPVRDYL